MAKKSPRKGGLLVFRSRELTFPRFFVSRENHLLSCFPVRRGVHPRARALTSMHRLPAGAHSSLALSDDFCLAPAAGRRSDSPPAKEREYVQLGATPLPLQSPAKSSSLSLSPCLGLFPGQSPAAPPVGYGCLDFRSQLFRRVLRTSLSAPKGFRGSLRRRRSDPIPTDAPLEPCRSSAR